MQVERRTTNQREMLRRLKAEKLYEMDAPPAGRNLIGAVKTLADENRMKASKYRDQQVMHSSDGIRPEIWKFARGLVKKAAEFNIPLYAHDFSRTREEQAALVKKGVSKTMNSKHVLDADGVEAVDIVHSRRAWQLTDAEWKFLGVLGKEVARAQNISIIWGGDWKSFPDPAHWELKK